MPSLVLLAHGSLNNPNSSAPCHEHATNIRTLMLFDQVLVGFWKEEPSLSRVLNGVHEDDEVFVVPFFMAEGYFNRVVIPRELGLSDPRRVTLCDVVGTHPAMTDVILERVDGVRRLLNVPHEELTLVIAGHGTTRNPRSSASVLHQVETLTRQQRFAEVLPAFLDQPPLLEHLTSATDARHIVVVPMFTADGFHTFDQIPSLVGLETGTLPVIGEGLDGRTICCTEAIGRAPGMVDVILDRVREHTTLPTVRPQKLPLGAEHVFMSARAKGSLDWGHVRLSVSGDELRLTSTGEQPTMVELPTLESLRRWCRMGADGSYRSLPTDTSMRAGWSFGPAPELQIAAALELIYPGRLAALHRLSTKRGIVGRSMRTVAARQTGAFAGLKHLTAEHFERCVEHVCDTCLCSRFWGWDDTNDDTLRAVEPKLVCLEPCPTFLNDASRKSPKP